MKSCPSACALLAVTAAAYGLNLPANLERAGFERNEGQFDTRVRFTSRARGVDLYLQQDRVVFAANNSQLGRLEWKGAKRPGSVEGVHALATRSNYYTGSDPSRWLTGVGVAPLDLAVANIVGRSITTLRGDGKGGFTALPETPTKGPLLFGVGDLNGDGGPDLAVPILGPPGISLLLTTPPVAAGVANAASYAAGGVSPGEIVVVAGERIGPEQLMGLDLDANGNVKTQLGGTRFLFDGVAAPLVYDAYSQSGVIVPYGVAGRANTQLVVETDGVRSAPLSLPVIPAKPGLFSTNASGTWQGGAVLNQNTSRNSMENPAEKGSIVVVFGTGSGMNDPPSVDGRITAAAGKPVLPFSGTFGGMTAEVLYLGPAPALVAGVFQANLRVPANVASGNIPVTIRIGNAVSQTGLTVAVK